jgi:hypothetical protein
MAITQADLDRIFTYHPPKPDQVARFRALRELARQFANGIVELSKPSREQSMAISHVQEAVMCVNAAIAIHESEIPIYGTEAPDVEKA